MRPATLVFLVLFVFGAVAEASAHPPRKKKKTAFKQGQSTLQAGTGFPSLVKPNIDTLLYFGEVKRKLFPPIQLRYEYAVTGNIGIGGMIGYASADAEITDNTDPENINGFKYTYILAGARGAFHPSTKSPKFDPYVVGFAGLNLTTISPYGPSNPLEVTKKTFLWSLHAGANFYFVEKIGAFAEVGYGVAVVNAGVTFKFGG